jgi:SnoaL-like domain
MNTRTSSVALIALVLIGAVNAVADPVHIDGGALDPAFDDTDVYVGVPAQATATGGAACRVAQEYIKLVRDGQYTQVAALFAADAVVLEPTRQHVQGREAITQFYAGTIGRMRPDIVAVSYVGNDRDCMVSIAVRITLDAQSRYKLASVDHFTLDSSGNVQRMVAYVRPGRASLR